MYIEELYEEEKISSCRGVSHSAGPGLRWLLLRGRLTTLLGIPRPSSFLR